MEEMLQQYVNNLSAGDQTTLIATLLAAVAVFFVVKMLTGMVKALIIIVVLLVGAALLFPDAQVMDKVSNGAQTALEKGKALTEKLGDAATSKVAEKLKEAAQKAAEH